MTVSTVESELRLTVSTMESERKLPVSTEESEGKMTASRVESDIKFTESTVVSEPKLTVSTAETEPKGVQSHLFFICRLRPSIYPSPKAVRNFKHLKIFEILAPTPHPKKKKKSPILYLDLKKNPQMHRNDP